MKKSLSYLNLIAIIIIFYYLFKLQNNFFNTINISKPTNIVNTNNSIIFDFINSRISDNFSFTIAVVAILFAVLSVIILFGVKEYIIFEISKYNSKIEQSEINSRMYHNKLNDLKSNLSYQMALFLINETNKLGDNDNKFIIENSLNIIHNLLIAIEFDKNKTKKSEKRNRHLIEIYVYRIFHILHSNIDIVVDDISLNTLKEIKSKIDKLCFDFIIKDFSYIYSALKIRNEQ